MNRLLEHSHKQSGSMGLNAYAAALLKKLFPASGVTRLISLKGARIRVVEACLFGFLFYIDSGVSFAVSQK